MGHQRTHPRPAVFIDRDGTLIEEVNYLSRVEQVQLTPGAAEAVAMWNAARVPVIVVTNQAGVARGYFPESRIAEIHQHLSALLAEFGAHVDAYYYCPHHPDGLGEYRMVCECRKPQPGMLLAAAHDHGLDLTSSWMIGDRIGDLEAGASVGCTPVLVLTGYGKAEAARMPTDGKMFAEARSRSDGDVLHGESRPASVVDNLAAAAQLWKMQRDHTE